MALTDADPIMLTPTTANTTKPMMTPLPRVADPALDASVSDATSRFVEECLGRAQNPGRNVYSGATTAAWQDDHDGCLLLALAIYENATIGDRPNVRFAFEAAADTLFDAQGNRALDFEVRVAALDAWVSALPVCEARSPCIVDEFCSLATVGAREAQTPLRRLPTVRPHARAIVLAQERFVDRFGHDLTPLTRDALARQDRMETEQATLLARELWNRRPQDNDFRSNLRFVAQSKLAAALRTLLGNPRAMESAPRGAIDLDHVVTALPENLRSTVDAVVLNAPWARSMPETFARAEALALRGEVDAQRPNANPPRSSTRRI